MTIVAKFCQHFLLGICVSMTLVACSATPQVTEPNNPQVSAPKFSGPYAKDLTEAYQKSKSDYFRRIITDSKVTDAEYQEARNRSLKCLRENGFKDVEYTSEGVSVSDRTDISDEEESKLFTKCENEAGLIDTEVWYNTLRANPDNVDWPTAERDCLVKAGLLEPGTTVEQMNQWYQSGHPDSKSPKAYICAQDPLGKLGLK